VIVYNPRRPPYDLRHHPHWPDGFDFHEHIVKHHSNHDLATRVAYTHGKSPEETRDEILSGVKRGWANQQTS